MTARCERCGIDFAHLISERCPICGGVIAEMGSAGNGDDSFGVAVATVQFSCDQCAAIFVLDATNACPACGEPSGLIDGIDPRAKRRQERYGSHIQGLKKELRKVDWQRLKFA